jgi:hypothetical protein
MVSIKQCHLALLPDLSDLVLVIEDFEILQDSPETENLTGKKLDYQGILNQYRNPVPTYTKPPGKPLSIDFSEYFIPSTQQPKKQKSSSLESVSDSFPSPSSQNQAIDSHVLLELSDEPQTQPDDFITEKRTNRALPRKSFASVAFRSKRKSFASEEERTNRDSVSASDLAARISSPSAFVHQSQSSVVQQESASHHASKRKVSESVTPASKVSLQQPLSSQNLAECDPQEEHQQPGPHVVLGDLLYY